jgi:hypothetical protein
MSNNIHEILLANCKAVAEELERVGKKPYHECGECNNCMTNLNANGEIVSYTCEAKSDDGDEYNVTDTDDICEHGDLNMHTRENEPCEDFDPTDGDSGETFYESMYDWLNDQLDIEYTITAKGEYKHGCVTTGTGGPYIEVDTGRRLVLGYRGIDTADAYVSSDTCNTLDEALEEMYESVMG